MSKSKNLGIAKKDKNDEFYTKIEDINNELKHYKNHFVGKIVFCNCDNPEWSNFWKFFDENFESLGLKKLISIHFRENESSYKLEKTSNGIVKNKLEGNGDFRSQESIDVLKESDIVVTNPPFSLFREYMSLLNQYEKSFLIIGSQNAITYKEFFPLLKNNKVWLGNNYIKSFIQPDGVEKKFGNICWFTNLKHEKRSLFIDLNETYKGNEDKYPYYDNYDAIEVSKLKDIPSDFDGIMGVPITLFDKYNPEQFDIVGLTSGRNEFECHPSKRYKNAIQHNPNGTKTSGSKANTRATLKLKEKPESTYYTADNSNDFLKIVYARILIKKK